MNSALHPAKQHLNRLSSYPQVNLNLEGIDFPTPISQIPKFEKQNDLAINVYGYERKVVPYHISNQPREMNRINLLLLHDKDNYHYCWIKNLNRLLAGLSKKYGKNTFVIDV